MTIKLNIGAGTTEIPGFTPVDIKTGTDARDLSSYEDGSVDEIRASHVLEHFTFKESLAVLDEFNRVLKPGGKLRVAVPDIDKCVDSGEKRLFYMFGGQTDEHDVHKSGYDKGKLSGFMAAAGFDDIREWQSDGLDTSAHPVSLNLEGVKVDEDTDTTEPRTQNVKITAYMTLPRYEAVASRSVIEAAMRDCGIGLATSTGVFWGQCMQRMFNIAVKEGNDWILSIDSDSLFSTQDVKDLCQEFGNRPDIDAMAALQCRRGSKYPLMTMGGVTEHSMDNKDPIKVTSAHFGLTLIRTSALMDVPKPWFYGEADEDGEWGDDRLDPDIWFWHQWRLAGKSVYVAPRVSIGHLEETVAVFDENLQPKHEYLHEWREKNLSVKQYVS